MRGVVSGNILSSLPVHSAQHQATPCEFMGSTVKLRKRVEFDVSLLCVWSNLRSHLLGSTFPCSSHAVRFFSAVHPTMLIWFQLRMRDWIMVILFTQKKKKKGKQEWSSLNYKGIAEPAPEKNECYKPVLPSAFESHKLFFFFFFFFLISRLLALSFSYFYWTTEANLEPSGRVIIYF